MKGRGLATILCLRVTFISNVGLHSREISLRDKSCALKQSHRIASMTALSVNPHALSTS